MRLFSVLTLAATSAPAFASFTESNAMTDAQFAALLSSNQIQEVFVAEGRIGNNALSTAERELGINNPAGAPLATGQFVWPNNFNVPQPDLVPFTLTYNAGSVTFDVDGTVLNAAFSGDINQLYIRTRAQDVSFWSAADLLLDSQTVSGVSFANANGATDVDYLVLTLNNPASSFTLSGNFSVGWDGVRPDRSELAVQIKATIPAPATGAFAGLTALAGLRRRR